MKKFTLAAVVAAFAAALAGCQPAATTTNNANMKTANSNTAVVMNTSTTNTGMTNTNTGMNNTTSRYSSNMSRTDYEKSTDYTADQAASKIGQGADDKWIWFKTKSAMATVNNMRDSTINVDVDKGVITLKGTVASKEEHEKALAAAKAIEGQKGVKDDLKVNAGDSVGNQMTGGGAMNDGDGKKAASNTKH